MKPVAILFIIALSYLHYRLWLGDGSVSELVQLQNSIEQQNTDNAKLSAKNRVLLAEVTALKASNDAIEERARNELGYIKEGETYFMIVDSSH